MKKRLNFLRNKVLIISIIVLLLISGTGIAAAYWKLAQNPGNAPSETDTLEDFPGYGSEGEEDFGVGKYFINPLPAGGTVDGSGTLRTPKDSTINYQISFRGKLDKNPNVARADVMILIDRSMSMKAKVPGETLGECFSEVDPGDLTYKNSKLCWSAQAINEFIRLTGENNRKIRVGYVTYAADQYTTNQVNSQNLKPLADMWDDTQRNQTKKWLGEINFIPNPNNSDPSTSGTAMGKATNFALDELQANGRADVQKYIIILTDGVGNLNPLMTGCASWRRTPSDAWPTGLRNNTYQTCQACPWGGGLRGDPKTCKNPPTPDPSLPPSLLNFLPPYLTSQYPTDLVDCCISSEENAKVFQAYPPLSEEIKVTSFNNSPVGKAVASNIKMPSIGFGIVDDPNIPGEGNVNGILLRKIAQATHKGEPNAAEEWAFLGHKRTPADIIDDFEAIFYGISGDRAVPIHFEETLPAGVDLSKITIERNVKNLEDCPASNNYYCRRLYTTNQGGGNSDNNIQVDKNDLSGRMVISFDLAESHYTDGDNAGRIPFVNKKFFVTLTVNTTNAAASAFDLDQNFDPDCGGSVPRADIPVSSIRWNFNFPEPHQIKTNTPKLCVGLRTQYTGDVYGLGINNYLFPGIDVLVSGSEGIASPKFSQAVWELDKYNFSATSFSNFGTYQNYLKGQIDGLIQKARPANINSALQLPADSQGKIFYVAGNVSLDGIIPIPMGPGIRTVIVEGNLNINQGIVKAKHESTAAVIVRGNVTIGDAKSIEAGIISPKGLIKIDNTSNYLNILGFLIGNNVQLKGLGQAVTQSINYDINLTKFPPPGLAGLSLPLYQEIAP